MIAVTGLGVISSLGTSVGSFWNNLSERSSGQFEEFLDLPNELQSRPKSEQANYPLVAEVRFSNEAMREKLGLSKSRSRRFSRTTLFALCSIKEAIADSGLDFSKIDPKKIGIFGGTTLAGTDELEKIVRTYQLQEKITSIREVLSGSYGVINDAIAEVFKIEGTRAMVSTACSSSTVVMKIAKSMLDSGELEVAIVFGSDPIAEVSISGFKALGAVTDGKSSPFSHQKNGITLGEGSAAILMQKETPEMKTPYAWFGGAGLASDAYHPTAPDPSGRGAKEAMREAIRESGISPENVDLVIAHGTGTELNDPAEAKAITEVAPNLKWIMSSKGATGHMLGSAGVMNALIACLTLKKGRFPASPAFQVARKGCPVPVSSGPTEYQGEAVIANSFGFGGSSASSIFLKNKPESMTCVQSTEPLYITGMGAVTTFGGTIQAAEAAILSGSSGIKSFQENKSFTGKRVNQFSGRVNFELPEISSILKRSRHARRMDRLSSLSYVGCSQALKDSGFKINSKNQKNVGLILGNDTGPLSVIEQFYRPVALKGVTEGNPLLFPNTVLNASLGYVTMDHGIHGPAMTIAQGEGASGFAMCVTEQLLRGSDLNMIIVGGSDEVSDFQEKAYLDLGHIPSNEAPSAMKPFQANSKGFFLGESNVTFVVEKKSSFVERGGKGRKYLFEGTLHSGASRPGENRFDQDGASVKAVLEEGFNKFGVPSLIIANGTGHKSHDEVILSGIERANVGSIPLYSVSGVFGNCRGTSSAMGVFAGTVAIDHQLLPSENNITLNQKGNVDRVFIITSGVGGFSTLISISKVGEDV
jgi:3-oxoacyl-[acyl-carrier-protein] synthase II